MSAWDQDFIDEEEEGYFEFDDKGSGEFHFGYVHGHMDCSLTTRDGEPAVEWTWDGNDEMDPAQGRGWAVVKGDELHGMIFFHGGDDSEFVAKKKDGEEDETMNEKTSIPARSLSALQGQRIHRHRHGPSQRDTGRTGRLPAGVRGTRPVGAPKADVLGDGEG